MSLPPPRRADHDIDPVFVKRHSPRAFTGEAVPEAELMRMIEAARWSPSAYNSQPWRFLYALRDTPDVRTVLTTDTLSLEVPEGVDVRGFVGHAPPSQGARQAALVHGGGRHGRSMHNLCTERLASCRLCIAPIKPVRSRRTRRRRR